LLDNKRGGGNLQTSPHHPHPEKEREVMKLEDQVCSLDLAKRLKELGVKQESYFYWSEVTGEWKVIAYDAYWGIDGKGRFTGDDLLKDLLSDESEQIVSAFTVAELLEILPPRIVKGEHPYLLYLRKDNLYMYSVQYLNWGRPDDHGVHVLEGWDIEKGAANSLAKMLIYLIENNLLKV